jgi:hypothetical protein
METETNKYIYPIKEIDKYIISYLNPIIDFSNLRLVNKYYYEFITQDKLLVELRKLAVGMTKSNIKFGKINIFMYACKHGYSLAAQNCLDKYDVDIFAYKEDAFKLACYDNHIETAKWLYELCNKIDSPINIHIDDDYVFLWVCYSNYIEMTKWLWKLGIKYQSSSVIPFDIHVDDEFLFIAACSRGHAEMARWLYKESKKLSSVINIHGNDDEAFISACENGHIDIAKWLYKKSVKILDPINILVIKNAFVSTCAYAPKLFSPFCLLEKKWDASKKLGPAELPCSLWRWENRNETFLSQPVAMQTSSHIEIIKWLWELSIKLSFGIDIEEAFGAACGCGDIEIAEWLWELSIESYPIESYPIDIHANNNEAFRDACENNLINMAQWLYELGNKISSPFDIHMGGDEIFKFGCLNNCIDIVKWLYKISIDTASPIDIHAIGVAFNYACRHRHTELINWFCEINNSFSYPGNFGPMMI